ncbi:MAG: tRNA (adenosine(37)-N6)-threonylcarbamoyltransferase complex ATPase subunit type 1 TsaE [Gemmatimonadota bacterium]
MTVEAGSGRERRERERGARPAELTEEALEAWGRRLGARAAEAGTFVALVGPLGSGKTRLVQAACRGCAVVDPVLSPTFTLVHRYMGGQGPVYHCDLYRLRDAGELADLGWDDLLAAEGPVYVEWAERASGALPGDRWEIRLEIGARTAMRTVRAVAYGRAPPVPDPGGGEDPAAAQAGSPAPTRAPAPKGSPAPTGSRAPAADGPDEA